MKRIISIFIRDLNSSFREFMLTYMLVAPILLAIAFKFFIPSVSSASLQFALDSSIREDVIKIFNQYGKVETYDSIEEIKSRVNDIDDVAGIIKNENDNFVVILEGNESHDTVEVPQMIIRDIESNNNMNINYSVTNIGMQISPVTSIGTTSIIITAIMIGGIIVGLNIIEEKQSGTIRALNVSPMKKFEFILGKSLIGIIIPIIQVYIILWILGFLNINLYMVFTMTIVSSLLVLIIGFLIGIISENQIAGIANMKFLMIIVSIAIIGAIMLPQNKHFMLYWSPSYWTFMGLKGIITDTISWSEIGLYSLWILGLTLIIFFGLRKSIKKGLV